MTGARARRVLVVEDDPEIAYLLGVVLAGEDREVVTAGSGEEALRVLGSGGVALVVLDLILPDIDGRSLLSQVREHPQTASTPVVVLTARVGPDTRQDCYRLGADAFVEKPFDPEVLAADISVRLERAAEAERAAHGDALTSLLNRAGLQARCEEMRSGYTLAVLEIDAFAERSERWKWDQTERVTKAVARALASQTPERVALARMGGEDFAFLMAGSDAEAMGRIAASALEAVRSSSLDGVDEGERPLTATVAVVVAEPGAPLAETLDTARHRIFRTREAEGDRVLVEEPAHPDRKARVLVAEDDEISATILLHRLEKEGLDVVRFEDGQDAYEAAQAEVPDLVILDVKMPGMDGFEVLGRLRKDPRYARTPIIMLTSLGQEADVVRGFGLGADDYILKPFSPTELTARVRRLLTRGRSSSAV
ncbi:MAG TPA: response regulator [Longimicrobiales bacterium]|nr:response regulator [Longimicrobiales bacterium]